MGYRCLTDTAELQAYIAGADVVAFDIETAPDDKYRADSLASLDAHRAHIVGISLSAAEGDAVYVPLAHRAGGNADGTAVLGMLAEKLFWNTEVTKVVHNLAFESMFLYALGIVLQPPCYDTMMAAMLTLKGRDEFRGLHDSGLKQLVPEILGVELPTFSEVTDGRFFDELDPRDAETVRYACADSDFCFRLRNTFNAWFGAYMPKHRTVCERIESPTAVYCGLMKYNGVLMDTDAMRAKQAECDAKIAELKDKFKMLIGDIEVGSNCSTAAFRKYIYEELKLPVLKVTEKNEAALDDTAMVLLADWCKENRPEVLPLFELISEYRKWTKVKTTYLDGYLKYVNGATGRIHPSLMQMATDTGRFACRNPNVQNFIAPGKDPVGVRNFVTAPEGCVLIEADYSQIEMRLAAYLSGDKVMTEAYRSGADIHAITTSAVFGIPIEEAADKSRPDYKHRRTVAKGTMFGILYGIGPNGLSVNLKTNAGVSQTPEECATYIRGILDRYPSLEGWQKRMGQLAKKYSYVATLYGRRRYLPDIRSADHGRMRSAERMAMNSPVQGLAADILKMSMGRLVIALRDKPWLRPTMTVHDSLVFEVEEARADEAVGIIRACMEAPPEFPEFIPLIAEAAVGKRYGELE